MVKIKEAIKGTAKHRIQNGEGGRDGLLSGLNHAMEPWWNYYWEEVPTIHSKWIRFSFQEWRGKYVLIRRHNYYELAYEEKFREIEWDVILFKTESYSKQFQVEKMWLGCELVGTFPTQILI